MNDSLRRILFICPDLNAAGAQQQCVSLASTLISRGHTCGIYTYAPANALAEKAQLAGVALHHFSRRGWWDTRIIAHLAQTIDEFQYSVVVGVLDWSYVYAARAIRRSHMSPALVSAVHMLTYTAVRDRARGIVCHRHVGASDRVVFVSRIQMDHWLDRGTLDPGCCTVVPNGVSPRAAAAPQERQATRSALGIGSGEFAIGMVGRFREEKRHDLAVESFAQALLHVPHMRLVFVGDGPTRERTEALSKSRGVESRVTFLGHRADVDAIYQGFDITLLCSDSEAMPMVILESLCHGVPIVSTNVGGISEVVSNSCGYLVPPGNASALSGALVMAAKAGQQNLKEMGLAGARLVNDDFSIEAMVDGYERAIEEAIRHHGSS